VRRFACFLVACGLAASASATEVEVPTAARPARAKTEAPILRAKPAPARADAAPIKIASLVRPPESLFDRTGAASRKIESPVRKHAPDAVPARALPVTREAVADRKFTFKDRTGRVVAAPIVDQYQKSRIVYPLAKVDPRINPRLARAASIAQDRAHAHSKSRCWRYVKNALLASGIISSYPKTAYAKQAGEELVRDYGFKKLPIRDPYKAPIGAVLVYGSRRAAGHVEIRTKTGFVSDFQNKKPSPRPLIGVYAKA
jgi:hypothetical protein